LRFFGGFSIVGVNMFGRRFRPVGTAMDASTPIEQHRLDLQCELDAAKAQSVRNRLGQFATPTRLAHDVLRFAYSLLQQDAQVRFLDPAVGTGSFYSALLRVFPSERIAAAAGIEIDP
jgi:adenine-specific DNA-methyltransferase